MDMLAGPTERPVLIMDVDETLFDTAPRKRVILRDVLNITATLEDIRADYYLTHYLHTPEQVKTFFREFHSGKYLKYEQPIEHSPQVLQRLAGRVTLVYLTGRHADGVQPWMAQRSATVEALTRFDFPVPDNTHIFLLMKPYFSGFESLEKQADEDRTYKTQMVSQIVANQDVIAGVGDSFSDISVYSQHNIFPICLKRPHFSSFKNRLHELPIQPFLTDNWLTVEQRIVELLDS